MNKTEILNIIKSALNEKIDKLQNLIDETRASNNDNKSSMGDKYETGREMLQQQINNLQIQLNEMLKQQNSLKTIFDKASDKAEKGAMVQTEKGWFYIAVSLGEIYFMEYKIFVISPESPLATAMNGKREGENFSLNSVNQKIINII